MIGWIALLLAPLAPLLCAILCPLLQRPRALLALGALPALAASMVSVGAEVSMPGVLLGVRLRLDWFGAVFMGAGALVWLAAGVFATRYLGAEREKAFCLFWCLTLAGVAGAFSAADAATFYVSFALLSLAAFPLVAHSGDPEALRAARVYITLAVLGETCLLVALMIAATAAGSIQIDDIRASLMDAPSRDLAIAAFVAGFGLKAGLAPLHVWLPLAHSAAPIPASAVLSGVIVKAGILGLARFLPADAGLVDWGIALTWAGLATAYLGALLGLAQTAPKPALAYSTMSQMGLLVAVFAAGLDAADPEAAAGATALYAAHHGLAKGALFLAVGLVAASGGAWARGAIVATAILGAALAGLPFSGGALAKLAAKGPLGDGVVGAAASLASIGTMLVMLRFLALLAASAEALQRRPPLALLAPFAGLAIAAFVLPWAIFQALTGLSPTYALAPPNIWAGTWPILLAIAIAAAALRARVSPRAIPPGDVVMLAEAALRRLGRFEAPHARGLRMDLAAVAQRDWLRDPFARWPVATAALAVIALVVGVLSAL